MTRNVCPVCGRARTWPVQPMRFGRDARKLHEEGDHPMAIAYETIRDELRECASEVR